MSSKILGNFTFLLLIYTLKSSIVFASNEIEIKKQCELNDKNEMSICKSNPCMNGGTCIPVEQANAYPPFACICTPAFKGLFCNQSISRLFSLSDYKKCNPNPCLNGGLCIQTRTNFTCDCPSNYNGILCEKKIVKTINLCTPTSCFNRGLCVTQKIYEDQYQVFCFCPTDFTGSQCQTSINSSIIEFYKNSCNNNGVYINGTCKCFGDFYGGICQFKYKPLSVSNTCPDKLCSHGICKTALKRKDLFYCVCQPGWVGTRCNIKNYCESSICQNGGTCFNDNDGYICHCHYDYFGKNCENNVSKNKTITLITSHKSKCLNGGTTDNEYDYSPCRCLPGYIGFKCEIHVCIQPVLKGACFNNNMQRYYFNTLTKQCQSFSYTGCQGNQNNFESLESCKYHCVKPLSIASYN